MSCQGANVIVLPSKVVPETIQSDIFRFFFGSLGRRWGHLGVPVASQSPFKKFSKIIEFSVIFGSPRGSMPRPPRGSPGSKKRTFSAKVAISLQRGANFQFLDFGTPLEKSVSLTFSEQWLCHFSKGSGGVFPVGAHGSEQPHATHVHGGTLADIYIYIYIYIYINKHS